MPPSASSASRRPPLRSKGSVTGSLVDPRTRREIVYESTLERDLAYILLASPLVRTLYDQPKAVRYRDRDDVERSHTFDFLAVRRSGRRIAFAVKPRERVKQSGIRHTLDLIRAQVHDFADCFELRTETHITRNRAWNARAIVRALRMRDEDAIAAVKLAAMELKGAISIRQLLSMSLDSNVGMTAVLCLLKDGLLVHDDQERITGDSLVTYRLAVAKNCTRMGQNK